MPNSDVTSPVTSVPIDRLALGVGWLRPGVAGIGGTLSPSTAMPSGGFMCVCFEGSEE
jgi:hypothetical protein